MASNLAKLKFLDILLLFWDNALAIVSKHMVHWSERIFSIRWFHSAKKLKYIDLPNTGDFSIQLKSWNLLEKT